MAKKNTFRFTKKSLETLKPTQKTACYFDEGQMGLRLIVTKTGHKSYQFQKWSRDEGKPLCCTIGKFNEISLKDARDKAVSLLSDMTKGVNIETRKRDEHRARLLDPTVTEFANEFIEKHCKIKKRSWKEDQRILDKDILPVIGKLRMKQVAKRDILGVLDIVEKRGKLTSCNRTLAVLSKMFGFALERDVIETFPVYGVKKRGPEVKRSRILSDDEIKLLWNTITPTSPVNMLLKFLLATGQRTGETRQMRWQEINDNIWMIPGEKTKNNLTHYVPLNYMALEILKIMRELSSGEYVFPGRVIGKNEALVNKCIAKDTASHHLSRVIKDFDWPRTTCHDLRRTFRSNLAKLGISKTVAEKVLNHKEQGISATYDHHEYLTEKTVAMNKWNDHLNKILTGEEAKVISISFGK